jgi:ElaB/YqjD/DUF883 family membrane-anchored ribosome-binding protein
MTMPSNESSRTQVADEFAAAMNEAQEMLERAATETGDKARDLRSQVETKLLHAKLRLQELEGDTIDRAKTAARATDDYVHDHPWTAIAVSAVIGFLLGMLLNRR